MLAKRIHQSYKLRVLVSTFPTIDESTHHLQIACFIVSAAVDAIQRRFHLVIAILQAVRLNRQAANGTTAMLMFDQSFYVASEFILRCERVVFVFDCL